MKALAFDNSPLSHFARAGELTALEQLTGGHRRVTTRAVMDELRRGVVRYPAIRDALSLPWLEVVAVDSLDELYAFARYMQRLGNSDRNAGEASVLAWAEEHDAVAYVDDQVACNAARQQQVKVYRTLGLVAEAFRKGLFTEARCQELVDRLVDEDARFPAAAKRDFMSWAQETGQL